MSISRSIRNTKTSTHLQSGSKSDKVNFRDFKRVLAACGIKTETMRAKAIFLKIDKDHNGTIDFNEFVQGLYGVDKTVSDLMTYCMRSLSNSNTHDWRVLAQGLKNTVDWGSKMAKIRELNLSKFSNKPITDAKILMKEIRRKVATAGPTKHQVTKAFRRFKNGANTQTVNLSEFKVSCCFARRH